MMNRMDQNYNVSQSNIVKQLDNSNRVINDIHTKLGSLEQTARNIQDIGNNISTLTDLLQPPKLRGNLGEYLLEDLLRQIFPAKNFETKHSFSNGTQVDAVIKLAGRNSPGGLQIPSGEFSKAY